MVDTNADPDNDPTNDPTVVPLTPTPKVKLVKTASLAGTGTVGSVITYTFTVTNVGNVTLSSLNVSDAKLGLTALAVSPSSLAPNAIGTATATYTITQADINAGEVKNTALATGTPPSGPNVTDVSDSGDELVDTNADPDNDPTNDPTVVPFPQQIPTFTAVAAICAGANLAPLPTTSNNGITGTWSPALDNMLTRTYTFTPTAGQNAANATMTITVYENPNFSLAQTNISCMGAADGVITITTTSGKSPFTYSINDGATFPNNSGVFNNLGPNTYKLAVKDANGCVRKCN